MPAASWSPPPKSSSTVWSDEHRAAGGGAGEVHGLHRSRSCEHVGSRRAGTAATRATAIRPAEPTPPRPARLRSTRAEAFRRAAQRSIDARARRASAGRASRTADRVLAGAVRLAVGAHAGPQHSGAPSCSGPRARASPRAAALAARLGGRISRIHTVPASCAGELAGGSARPARRARLEAPVERVRLVARLHLDHVRRRRAARPAIPVDVLVARSRTRPVRAGCAPRAHRSAGDVLDVDLHALGLDRDAASRSRRRRRAASSTLHRAPLDASARDADACAAAGAGVSTTPSGSAGRQPARSRPAWPRRRRAGSAAGAPRASAGVAAADLEVVARRRRAALPQARAARAGAARRIAAPCSRGLGQRRAPALARRRLGARSAASGRTRRAAAGAGAAPDRGERRARRVRGPGRRPGARSARRAPAPSQERGTALAMQRARDGSVAAGCDCQARAHRAQAGGGVARCQARTVARGASAVRCGQALAQCGRAWSRGLGPRCRDGHAREEPPLIDKDLLADPRLPRDATSRSRRRRRRCSSASTTHRAPGAAKNHVGGEAVEDELEAGLVRAGRQDRLPDPRRHPGAARSTRASRCSGASARDATMLFEPSRAHPGTRVRLAYCLNLHPAHDARRRCSRACATITLPLRERLARRRERFGVGLYLPRALARAARRRRAARTSSSGFAHFLATHGLDPFTFNAFPYGGFHAARVSRRRCSEPTWSRRRAPARSRSTSRASPRTSRDAARLATRARTSRSARTPGALRAAALRGERRRSACASRTWRARSRALARLEERQRRALRARARSRAAREPRATTRSTSRRFLEPRARALRRGAPSRRARRAARARHLGVCLDACHSAVEFEEPREALGARDARTRPARQAAVLERDLGRAIPGANPARGRGARSRSTSRATCTRSRATAPARRVSVDDLPELASELARPATRGLARLRRVALPLPRAGRPRARRAAGSRRRARTRTAMLDAALARSARVGHRRAARRDRDLHVGRAARPGARRRGARRRSRARVPARASARLERRLARGREPPRATRPAAG